LFWLAIAIVLGAMVLLVVNHDTGSVAGLEAENFSQLAGGAAWVLLISAGLVFAYRGRKASALRHALIWIAMAAAIMAAYAFRAEFGALALRLRAELQPGFAVEQTAADGAAEVVLRRRLDGHFSARSQVNGAAITFLVDTGASSVTLTQEDAARAGLKPDRLVYTVPIQTANGRTRAAAVRLERIAIGNIAFSGVRALVVRPGQLNESLLGINFLSRLSSYEVRGDRLVLRAPR
jgi:aspartyl protease family protein